MYFLLTIQTHVVECSPALQQLCPTAQTGSTLSLGQTDTTTGGGTSQVAVYTRQLYLN